MRQRKPRTDDEGRAASRAATTAQGVRHEHHLHDEDRASSAGGRVAAQGGQGVGRWVGSIYTSDMRVKTRIIGSDIEVHAWADRRVIPEKQRNDLAS